jgi:arabinogalactan endo-1,4-beta-galactosidase
MTSTRLFLPVLLLAGATLSEPVPERNQMPPRHQPAPAPEMARGADIGWLSEMESAGRVLRDSKGNVSNGLDILKEAGINSIRLRVWVNPKNGWCGKDDVVKMAKRARDKGFRIMIDFHYSDSWADPGQQTKPAAWNGHAVATLRTDIANHTKDVLQALKEASVTPEWVQIGNETNDGMLWDDGRASKNMANYASFVQSGSAAAKSIFPDAKVMVHVSNFDDNALFRWNFDGLEQNGASWDVIGMSLYPDTLGWRATTDKCLSNMRDMISRYGKKVMVAEVGLEWWARDSSYALLRKTLSDMKSLGDNGLGVFYWEPLSPSGWNGYQKGALDNTGKLTKAMDAFKEMTPSGVGARDVPAVAGPSTRLRDALGRIETREAPLVPDFPAH